MVYFGYELKIIIYPLGLSAEIWLCAWRWATELGGGWEWCCRTVSEVCHGYLFKESVGVKQQNQLGHGGTLRPGCDLKARADRRFFYVVCVAVFNLAHNTSPLKWLMFVSIL